MNVSIQKDGRNKNSSWTVRWYEPTDIETGKRKRRCKSFLTKQEAKFFAAELRLEQPTARISGGVLLSQFCRDWLRNIKPNIRPATFLCYEGTVERLLAYFDETCKLEDITPQKADEFISHLVKVTPQQKGQSLSLPAKQQHRQNCVAIFNKALAWGKLQNNPFAGLKRTRILPRRWHRLSPAEFLALFDVAPDLPTKCLYAILYTAGLRRSEALALRWCDIDFEKGRVVIAGRKGTDAWPPFDVKDHEAREIPLPAFTLNLLTTWQSQAPEGVPFVLLSKDRAAAIKIKWRRLHKQGKPWLNSYWQNNTLRNFKAHIKRAGIVPIGTLNIHTLRKNAGQNWADCLPMNVVKCFLGHADIKTTQEFYTQVDQIHLDIAKNKIQESLTTAREKADNETYERRIGQSAKKDADE